MDEASIAQLIFTLRVADEIASKEGPGFDVAVYRLRQAIEEIVDEALKQGIIVDIDKGSKNIQ